MIMMIEQHANQNLNQKQPSKRRMSFVKSSTVSILLATSILSDGVGNVNAFSLSANKSSRRQPLDGHLSIQTIRSSARSVSLSETKSHTALNLRKTRKSSRLGIRKRARSVLAKAKTITGIKNSSDYVKERKLNGERKERQIQNGNEENHGNVGRRLEQKTSLKAKNHDNIGTVPELKQESAEPVDFAQNEAPVQSPVNGKAYESSSVASTTEPIENSPENTVDTASIAVENIPKVNSIRRDSSVNTVAEAASIGGLGDSDLDFKTVKSADSAPTKKRAPASTPSKFVKPIPSPGDDIIGSESLTVVDAFKGDVSAAFSMPPPPLPFTLPDLDREQKRMLQNGERVQFQSDMGREGSGFVVVDVKAPSAVVWECLLDFYSYPETIPTVRGVQMFTNTHLMSDYTREEAVQKSEYEDGTLATLKHGVPSVTRAAFTLSKFRLKIAAIHKYRPHPLGDYMEFTLDPACTNVVLKNAKGVWHTQSNPDGKGDEYTRVWLLCELKVSSLLPQWITDYAAIRAMPRATTWIKPHVETAAELWYKDMEE